MRSPSFVLVSCALLAACGNKAPVTPPPSAPTGLAATGGAGQISLTWNAVSGAASYSILRGDAAGAETALATSTAAAYTDAGLAAGHTYFYVVQAVNSAGKSGNSNEASATTLPPAPTGLTASTTDTSVLVQWTASQGAASYDVLRASGGTTTFAAVGSTTTTSISDTGLTPNTAYVYAVRAKNASGTSADATVNATTAPVAPTGVSASASNHHAALTWTAAAGAGSGGYRVLRSTSASGPFTSVGTAPGTSFTDKFLTNNTAYHYVVHTIGGTGESGDSNQASATPFIEICTVDASSYAVSVFDGTASGNAPPKRSFGWSTGIAEGTGIGTDGTNIFIASKYTKTVNVYPRATVSGDQAPSAVINLPGQPTTLTVSGTEVYVGIGNKIWVYLTNDAGVPGAAIPVEQRMLTLPAGVAVNSGITGIQVFAGLTGTTSVNQTFVLADNKILVYANGASGTTAPVTTITPATTTQFMKLAGPAYDNSSDDAIFVGWYDGGALTGKVASYSRTTGTLVRGPFTSGTFNPYFDLATPGGLVVDGSDLWVAIGPTHNALVKYSRTAPAGAPATTGGFTGALTKIYKPGPLLLDASGELWFVNGKNGATAYSKTALSGNHAPARALTGESTGLYDPQAIAADRPSAEIVVLNQSTGRAISVFPSSPGSPVVPARQVVGASTTLVTMQPTFLAVDEANQEYWVDDRSSNNGFAAFASSPGGDVAPLRGIIRDVSLGPVDSMYYDPAAAQIVATATVAANNWTLSGWKRTDTGNVPADRSATLTAAVANTPAIDLVHDLLFVFTDSSVMSVFPRGFSGTLTATSTVDTTAVPATLSAVDGEGDELYFRVSDKIMVAPRPTGSALALSRTITGSSTKLYNTIGLAICN